MKYAIFSILLLFFLQAKQKSKPSNDPNFLTVTIDGTTWTAEDVHLPIPGAKCLDTACQQVLYTWKEAQQLDEQIPGWRLPTLKDWRKLEVHFGSGLMEEHSSVKIGKQVKEALQIKMLTDVFFPHGKANDYWVKPTKDVVDLDGSRTILTKRFYGSDAEKKDEIWLFATDADSEARCSVRLIKEE